MNDRLARVATLLLAALIVAVPVPVAGAAPAAGEVEFVGGGFGHGIGLSQYGAQGMALDGYTGAQIATHYFAGTSIEQVADVLPADNFLLTYAQPLWVGLLQNKLTFQFRAIGGDLELCQAGDGEGACPKSVTPKDGELWSFTFDGSQCQFEYNGSPQGNPGDCSASISWAEGTRVELPDLGLSFAHGTLKIRPVGSLPTLRFHVSLAVDIEDYIAGIDEMPPSWAPAALEAQAIAARSYAIAKAQQRETGDRVGTLADPGLSTYWKNKCYCHVRRTATDQVYNGWDQEQEPTWVAAATATAGQVLTHPNSSFTQNGVIEAFYTSSSVGVTETNVGGFGSSVQYPYLVSVDDYWASDPGFNPKAIWSKTATTATILSKLTATTRAWHADFDTLTGAALVNGPPEATVRFTGLTGGVESSVDVPGWWLRSSFGLTSPQVHTLWFSGVHRLWGADRYATAADVSADTFPSGVPVVFIADGESFPDALSAGAAASALGGPVLLTRKTVLPWATTVELSRLKPASIVIVGGEDAVSAGVQAQLGAYTTGTVKRWSGVSRYDTSAAISQQAFPTGAPIAYVASGVAFADALAGVPTAAADGAPLLLVRPDSIPPAIATELQRLAPSSIVVLGGTAAISADVEAQLGAYAGAVSRIGGTDRYDTAVKISQSRFGPGTSVVYVAIGTNYPDGLGGGAAGGFVGAPLLLVKGDWIPDVTRAEVLRLAPGEIRVLGGPGVIPADLETALQQLLP